MESLIINNAITVVIDMRNSSNLINDDNDVRLAEKIILEFNNLIHDNKGSVVFSKSTGDGYILIYETEKFLKSYKILNKLITEVISYIKNLALAYPNLKLGYGIGMQKSPVKIIKLESNIHKSEFLIGQSINTATKYAYYHNRTSLEHKEFIFDGILTTKTINNLLSKEGFEELYKCKEKSGISAYRIKSLKRR
ncbi:hypothetical protein HF295_02640 [Hujiaoplasma nucleasis]|uniref:Adenylate/guanylate cyclase domain-containing protein n=1 Tax=Hujiaoplasma nucleasis TaxID=2725268 RepID=A0A7L6N493_9MOLU|nr:hypothetical protein [Hujiaoplasma nucleasis]QLY39815.1 hypothetical protein HF295_02640 [Hujiaoplasma nucleasis]